MFCKKCGQPNDDDALFCEFCGARFNDPTAGKLRLRKRLRPFMLTLPLPFPLRKSAGRRA